MTIGLFFDISDRHSGRVLVKRLLNGGLPVQAFEVGSGWERLDGSEYRGAFAELGQIVVVLNDTTLRQSWLALLAGVTIGSDRELHLYEGNLSLSPDYPQYLSEAHKVRSSRDMKAELSRIYSYQQKKKQVEDAREQLMTLGYSVHEGSFAGAAAEGHLEAVDLFLKTGLSPDATSGEGLPVLTTAIRNQQESVARLLVERGADVNATSADRSNSPLMEAAGRGMNALVELFLEREATVNLQSDNGQTALMLAVAEGYEETALILLKNGADPHLTDKLGMSARKYAELYRHARVLEEIDKLSLES